MEFKFGDWIDQDVAMHCATEEEAIDFCNVMHKAGFRWPSGCSYATTTHYDDYYQDTAYNVNVSRFSYYQWYLDEGYKILEWSDYMDNKPELDFEAASDEDFMEFIGALSL